MKVKSLFVVVFFKNFYGYVGTGYGTEGTTGTFLSVSKNSWIKTARIEFIINDDQLFRTAHYTIRTAFTELPVYYNLAFHRVNSSSECFSEVGVTSPLNILAISRTLSSPFNNCTVTLTFFAPLFFLTLKCELAFEAIWGR